MRACCSVQRVLAACLALWLADCVGGRGEWPPPLQLLGQANISLDNVQQYPLGQSLAIEVGADLASDAIRYTDGPLQDFFAQLREPAGYGDVLVEPGSPVLHGLVQPDGTFYIREVIDVSDYYNVFQLTYEVTGEVEAEAQQAVGISAERIETIVDNGGTTITGYTFDLGTLSGDRRCAGRDEEPNDAVADARDLGTLNTEVEVGGCLSSIGQDNNAVVGDIDSFAFRVDVPSTLHLQADWVGTLLPAVYVVELATVNEPSAVLVNAYGEPPLSLDQDIAPGQDYLLTVYGFYGHVGPYTLTLSAPERVAACAADSALCDDRNLCTTDACDRYLGCSHVANANFCDDGNACTLNDICVAGQCQSGPVLDCVDPDPCTIDRCDATTGSCVHFADPDPACQ